MKKSHSSYLFIFIFLALLSPQLSAEPSRCVNREAVPSLQGVINASIDFDTAKKWMIFRDQREQERILEGFDPQRVHQKYRLDDWEIKEKCVDLGQIVDIGRGIFLRKFSRAEGYGHRFSDLPYQRFQRAKRGGPDASACEDCHWKGGFAGAGDRVDQSYLEGDGENIDIHESRNPPHLWGLGWVELLAQEMSASLHLQAQALKEKAIQTQVSQRAELIVQGISFGWLQVDALGHFDYREIEGVDDDLIIKPFAWKGVFPSIRDFVLSSFQKHFSLQATELIAKTTQIDLGIGQEVMLFLPNFYANVLDLDRDGISHELTEGQISAVVAFLATLDTPQIEIPTHGSYQNQPPLGDVEIVDSPEFAWRWQEGNRLFDEIGCAGCHIPYLRLKSTIYKINEHLSIDLSKQGAKPIPQKDNGVYLIPLFSDLKRHHLGSKLKSKQKEKGVIEEEYLTRRLWGLQQSAPYLHTGQALTIDEAVQGHLSEGSEANFAAENYLQLSESEKSAIRVYLQGLKRSASMRIR